MPPAFAPGVLLTPAVPSRRGGRLPAGLPSPTPANHVPTLDNDFEQESFCHG